MPRLSISAHGLVAVSAVAILLWIAFLNPTITTSKTDPIIPPMQAIGIEHTESFVLQMTASILSGGTVMELEHDSPTPITLSIPDDWKRHEVQHFDLAQLQETNPSLGIKRYTFPKGIIRFYVYHVLEHLTLHAPGNTPFTVRLTHVNVPRNTSDFNVFLVQETPTTLW